MLSLYTQAQDGSIEHVIMLPQRNAYGNAINVFVTSDITSNVRQASWLNFSIEIWS